MESLERFVEENSYDLCRGIKKFDNSDFINDLLNIIDEESSKRKIFLSAVRITDNYIKVIGVFGLKDETTFEYDFYIDSSVSKEVFNKLLERILINSYKKKECSIHDITCFNEGSNYQMIVMLKNRFLNNMTITFKYGKINELLYALELFRRKAKEFNNYELETEIENLDEKTLQERFARGSIKLTIRENQ